MPLPSQLLSLNAGVHLLPWVMTDFQLLQPDLQLFLSQLQIGHEAFRVRFEGGNLEEAGEYLFANVTGDIRLQKQWFELGLSTFQAAYLIAGFQYENYAFEQLWEDQQTRLSDAGFNASELETFRGLLLGLSTSPAPDLHKTYIKLHECLRAGIHEIQSENDERLESEGYIFVSMPDGKKRHFHDLLKGFEDFARLKGYGILFSIDGSKADRVAFKFTVDSSRVELTPDAVERDLADYLTKLRDGTILEDIPSVFQGTLYERLFRALTLRVQFLQQMLNVQKYAAEVHESLVNTLRRGSIHHSPNIVSIGALTMDSRNYSAIRSTNVSQGDHNSNQATQLVLASTFVDRKRQIEELTALIDSIEKSSTESPDLRAALRPLHNVKEELENEPEPDPGRLKRWFESAKDVLSTSQASAELIEKTLLVLKMFGIGP